MSKKSKKASVFVKPESEMAAYAPDAATQATGDAPAAETPQDPIPAPAPDTAAPVAQDATRKGRRGKATASTTPAAEPAPATALGGITMADLADRYVTGLREAGKGLGTQFSYSIDLAVAVKHFGPDAPVASLSARKVQNYFDSDAVTKTRSGKAKAKPGIDKTRRVLRLALDWATAEGLIPESPVPESARPKRGKNDAEAA